MITYPALVWRIHSSREGYVVPEIWYRECHSSEMIKGKHAVIPHVAAHYVSEEDQRFSTDILARLFPPPEPWKEWKQPNKEVTIDNVPEMEDLGLISVRDALYGD